MKIIQITDLHIDREGEYPFNIDVRKNFLRILNYIKSFKPDHLVISGDLCYRDGEVEIYEWIHGVLDTVELPYSVIAGNHDDSTMLAQTFGLEHLLHDGELYFARRIGKETVLFLDSGRGSHSHRQLNWLRRQLKNAQGELIVFMHHPPNLCEVPFMDTRYALQDIEEVQKVFAAYPGNVNVFCGHYHVEKTIRLGNLLIQVTPSCFFQIDQQQQDFKVDHHRIAFREIVLDNQQLFTTVRYFNGSRH